MWKIVFFNERVKRQINDWPAGIYADFLRSVKLISDYGVELKMPFSKPMGSGLFELRCKGKEGIGRAFYCTFVNHEIVILHAFIKKTQKTPKRELEFAKQRLKEIRK
jgi:phage-related protein